MLTRHPAWRSVLRLEVYGGTIDGNGAGIRQEGRNLAVRDCFFHHNQMGILTGNDAANAAFASGVHDTLIPSCDSERYRQLGAPDHGSCTDNFHAALGRAHVGPGDAGAATAARR